MLAKKHRLPIQEFIGKNGRVIKTPFFLLKIFPNQFPYSRFGIIISKKVLPKSTARNKLKRTIFSEIKLNFCRGQVCFALPDGRQAAGRDFLIIVSPKIKELEKEEIIKQLQELFNAIPIY